MQGKICSGIAVLLLLGFFLGAGMPAAGLEMVVKPYLNSPTTGSMVVRWETDAPASSVVRWGSKVPLDQEARAEGAQTFHDVKLDGLETGAPYFYQVYSRDAAGAACESEIYTFSTAAARDAAFGFVVFCDTQSNPDIVRRLATYAYAQRPAFTLVGGDLVSDGENKANWTGHFFPNMEPLNTRVPLVPILGNHDKNSHYFYDYFTLPDPEYHYQFDYGNLSVFLLDSQRSFKEGAEDYQWLETHLARCKATWKIALLHKPAYSSDEDDYGDTSETRSVFGDLNARRLAPLYQKYGVDIAWAGHIHSYERTWPLKDGKVTSPEKGVVYMVTGGGGGGLEKAGPVRAPISAKVFSGHHYCYVLVNGKTLRVEAYDADNRLFDWMELAK